MATTINPIYFQNTQERLVPDVMYKAPYEQIKENNQLNAELRLQNQSNINTLKVLTHMPVLPEDEDSLKRDNEGFIQELDSLTKNLQSGSVTTPQANLQITNMANKLYENSISGDRSKMQSRYINYQKMIANNEELLQSDPQLGSQILEQGKSLIVSNPDNKDLHNKIGMFKGVKKPTFNVDNLTEWTELQRLFSDVINKPGEVVNQDDVDYFLKEILSTGNIENLKKGIANYMKTFGDYYPHLTTREFGKSGRITDGHEYDNGDIDVFDKEHPYYQEAMAILRAVEKYSEKIIENPEHTARLTVERINAQNNNRSSGQGSTRSSKPPAEPTVITYTYNNGNLKGGDKVYANGADEGISILDADRKDGDTYTAYRSIVEGVNNDVKEELRKQLVEFSGFSLKAPQSYNSYGTTIQPDSRLNLSNSHNTFSDFVIDLLYNTDLKFNKNGTFANSTLISLENAVIDEFESDITYSGSGGTPMKFEDLSDEQKISAKNLLRGSVRAELNNLTRDYAIRLNEQIAIKNNTEFKLSSIPINTKSVEEHVPNENQNLLLINHFKGNISEYIVETNNDNKRDKIKGKDFLLENELVSVTTMIQPGTHLAAYTITYTPNGKTEKKDALIYLDANSRDINGIIHELNYIDGKFGNLGSNTPQRRSVDNNAYRWFNYYLYQGQIINPEMKVKPEHAKKEGYSKEAELDKNSKFYWRLPENINEYTYTGGTVKMRLNEAQLQKLGIIHSVNFIESLLNKSIIQLPNGNLVLLDDKDDEPITYRDITHLLKSLQETDYEDMKKKAVIQTPLSKIELDETADEYVRGIMKYKHLTYSRDNRNSENQADCSSFVARMWGLKQDDNYWNTGKFLNTNRKTDLMGKSELLNNTDDLQSQDIIIFSNPKRPDNGNHCITLGYNGGLKAYEIGVQEKVPTETDAIKYIDFLLSQGYIIHKIRPNKDLTVNWEKAGTNISGLTQQ